MGVPTNGGDLVGGATLEPDEGGRRVTLKMGREGDGVEGLLEEPIEVIAAVKVEPGLIGVGIRSSNQGGSSTSVPSVGADLVPSDAHTGLALGDGVARGPTHRDTGSHSDRKRGLFGETDKI